ncbi:MAG: UbiX family flavin prenyltransferase [Planctomycetes bacterium]|nr:UbiX family flavin prenyltransferase [Planctomycetota bacterium]NOG52996.1 UbiX family flavin prenyltransferase [Planctomycetota bacterium]
MNESLTNPQRIVVGITGASGAVYARRVIQELCRLGIEVHLVATRNGRRLLHEELGIESLDAAGLLGTAHRDQAAGLITVYPIDDVGAAIASGTFVHDGMVIVPCSSNGLGMIASGLGPNLLYRAAAVTLKERRRLVLCHRESPLSLVDIENMRRLALAGAIVAPANPGWYLQPQSLDDIVDFVAARLLDQLGIVSHSLSRRWGEDTP